MPSNGIEMDTGVVAMQKENSGLVTNWKIKYGMRHSQQCFSISNVTLKLDPLDISGLPK